MDDLISALKIFRKYFNGDYPTHCEHDVLSVDVDPSDVAKDDIITLEGLGFYADHGDKVFYSFKYGSC